MPPDGIGGYELHCEAVRRHLGANGHRVRVLVGRRGPAAAAILPFAVRRSLRWVTPGTRLERAEALAFERHNRAELADELDVFPPGVVCWWRLATACGVADRLDIRGPVAREELARCFGHPCPPNESPP